MRLKTLLAAIVALTGSTVSVLASDAGNTVRVPQFAVEVTQDQFIPVPQADVQGGAPIILAQATSPQQQQLEEQIRLLNGKVEELTFQILQLQEQMRKMQEDNEFRFQELENSKQGSVKPKESGNDVAATPTEEINTEAAASDAGGEVAAPADAPAPEIADVISGDTTTGEPPKTLGSIKFDENGQPIGGSIDTLPPVETETAALPAGNDPVELYRVAYDHVLAGEYADAEAGFRSHVEQFPADAQTSDARYWLGESLAAQDKHREAAEILLDAQRDFPKSKKAPDMLLNLGVSLAALDNKDVACATFNQVNKKYPSAGAALLERVAEEQAKAGC